MEQELDAAHKHLIAADPQLAEVIRTTDKKPNFSQHSGYYQTLVDIIVSQQLSVKAAATIQKRLNELFGDAKTIPTPEQILTKSADELRAVGLSRSKASYIQDLASKVVDGTVRFDHLDSLSNQEIVDELTQIKGVGEWTGHIFLMFCMGRLDVLPVGDLGIRKGVQVIYGRESIPTPQEVRLVADEHGWSPYESVASWYLWRVLNNEPAGV